MLKIIAQLFTFNFDPLSEKKNKEVQRILLFQNFHLNDVHNYDFCEILSLII